VQHIAHGFTRGFVEWLCTTTDFPLQIARQGETAMPGIGYVAPDGHHLGMAPGNRLKLHTGACINGSRPSVSYLFRSVAETCGPNTIGVLLTGMGRDGADELRLLRDVGALTIAQDKVSSVVHGMPGEAIKLNAAKYILAPDTIATVIASSLMRTPSHWK
jgi:two-component system chemotaxis response regulator CheB